MATGTIDQTLLPVTQAVAGTFAAGTSTGDIAQSLRPVAQILGGETIYFSLTDQVVANNVLVVNDLQILEDLVLVAENYSATIKNTLVDQVVASNTLEADAFTFLTTAAVAQSSFGSIETTFRFSPTGAEAADFLEYQFSATLTDLVEGESVLQTIRSLELHEKAYASELLVSELTGIQLLVSTVEVSGEIDATYARETLVSTVDVSGTPTDGARIHTLLTSDVEVSAVLTNTVRTFEELLATAVADNQIFFTGSTYRNSLTDVVLASGAPWARDFGALAWVLNTESGGLSTYDNFEFTSIAEYGGILYATSPEGVIALVGENDVGRVIQSEIQTGFLDFGVPETKRISDVFVGYTGGQLEFDVETYDGPQEVYTYAMEEREAIAPRNNRLKVGRGLSSRYWRFAIRNIDGANFQVYGVTAETGTSRRRL